MIVLVGIIALSMTVAGRTYSVRQDPGWRAIQVYAGSFIDRAHGPTSELNEACNSSGRSPSVTAQFPAGPVEQQRLVGLLEADGWAGDLSADTTAWEGSRTVAGTEAWALIDVTNELSIGWAAEPNCALVVWPDVTFS